MVAKELISEKLPFLKPTDTVGLAVSYMGSFKVNHLPVVCNMEYLGTVSDISLLEQSDRGSQLGESNLTLFNPSVEIDQHIFEILGVASTYNLSVIPVVDENNRFKGSILRDDLIKSFAQTSSISERGGIIILSINPIDYSLSQIAQIVESNNVRVLSVYITSPPNSSMMEVTLKVNTTELSSVIRTFERCGYDVKMWITSDKTIDQFYSERFDMLMKYLNI